MNRMFLNTDFSIVQSVSTFSGDTHPVFIYDHNKKCCEIRMTVAILSTRPPHPQRAKQNVLGTERKIPHHRPQLRSSHIQLEAEAFFPRPPGHTRVFICRCLYIARVLLSPETGHAVES